MEKSLTVNRSGMAPRLSPGRLCSFWLVGVAALIWFPASARAVTVRAAGAGGSVPTIGHDFDSMGPLTITLELFNEAGADQVIALWQLGLQLQPTGGASGEIEFSSVQVADDPLFSVPPGMGPGPEIMSPSTSIIVSDADLSLDFGQNLAAGTARNIVNLVIGSGMGAAGPFELRMLPFDLIEPDASLWFQSLIDLPQAFFNASASGPFVLATIEAIPEPASAAILALGSALGSLALARRRARRFREK